MSTQKELNPNFTFPGATQIELGDVDVDGIGAGSDSAATPGGAGELNAKLRLMTQQLDDIHTELEAIDTNTATSSGAGIGEAADAIADAGGEGTLSAKLRRVTDQLADLVTDSTALLTAVAAVESAVEAPTPAGTNVIGGARDAGPQWTNAFGVSGVRVTSADAQTPVAITDDPTSGQKIVLTDLVISVGADMRVDIIEETSGTVLLTFYMVANSMVQFTPRSKMKLSTADRQLMVDTSAAGNIAVTAFYYSEA